MSNRPLFIVIDIDGTLIGDVTPQVCEWELVQKYDKGKLKQFKKGFCDQLKSGLLRPGFTNFIDQIKVQHPNSAFFIYTSSEGKWANFLVPCIEQVTGVRFMRPLFTRTHCLKLNDEYKKSLSKIAPKIHERVGNQITLADLLSHTFLIDNSNVILKQEEKSIVLCPTYSFVSLRDVTRHFDMETLGRHYTEMVPIMASYNMFPRIDKQVSLQQFLAIHYRHVYQLVSQLHKERHIENDTDLFWSSLGNIMSKLDLSRYSKEAIVRMINDKLRYKGLMP